MPMGYFDCLRLAEQESRFHKLHEAPLLEFRGLPTRVVTPLVSGPSVILRILSIVLLPFLQEMVYKTVASSPMAMFRRLNDQPTFPQMHGTPPEQV